MIISRLQFLVVVILSAPLSAVAHHSFVAFDETKEAFVRGTVSAYDFRNPHTYIFLDVRLPNGDVESWRLESETKNDLSRNGWSETSFQPGDVLSVRVNPARDPARKYARVLSLEKTDGTVLAIPNDDDERGRSGLVPAASIEGVWLPIQTFRTFNGPISALVNDAARAEAAAYGNSGAQPPNTQCIDMSIPQRLGRAHVYEIELVSDSLILIHGEDDAEPRRIYLDGRDHPTQIPEAERSYTGHSIGRWEDDTLVIDTTHFKRQSNGHAGYPSGPQKHLTERFRLNEDKTQIEIEIEVDDPEYLTGALSHTFQWQHSPHITRLPHSCDPESALGYIVDLATEEE
jgi:hypothetical protein